MAISEVAFLTALAVVAGAFVAGAGISLYSGVILAVPAIVLAIWSFGGSSCENSEGVLGRSFRFSAILTAVFTASFFFYHLSAAFGRAALRLPAGEDAYFRGVVVAEPRVTDTSARVRIRLTEPYRGNVELILPPFPRIRYGDELMVKGAVRNLGDGETVSYYPHIDITASHKASRLREALISFKQSFSSHFKEFLPSENAALIAGLTFGIRADFSKGFTEAMRNSGTTHLVALSGYNIGILSIAVAKLLTGWIRRRAVFIVTGAVIGLFILMVGGEPSVVRAGIMGFLTLLAREVGSEYSFRNSVAIVAALMTLAEPSLPAHDLGFQLSFVSLLGIAYLEPILSDVFRFTGKGPGFLSWRENLSTTLGAQLAVAPLLAYHFGGLSLTSLAANVLILVFVPATMAFGFLLAGFASLSSFLGFAVAPVARMLTGYEISVIRFFGRFAMFSLGALENVIAVLVIYATLISVIVVWQASQKARAAQRKTAEDGSNTEQSV